MDKRFTQVEAEYYRLKGQYSLGRITREEFDTTLREMMIEDIEGYYWILGANSGKWYAHKGDAWIEGDPSRVRAAATDDSNPFGSAPKSAQPQLRRLPGLPLIAIGLGAAVCLIAGILGGLAVLLNSSAFLASPGFAPTIAPPPALGAMPSLATGVPAPTFLATRTPALLPTRTIDGPSFGPIICSPDFDLDTQKPIGARTDNSIPVGSTRLYVSWQYRGVDPNTTYSYYWFYGGQQFFAGLHKFPRSSGVGWANAGVLDVRSAPQTYRFDIRIGSQVIVSQECIIK